MRLGGALKTRKGSSAKKKRGYCVAYFLVKFDALISKPESLATKTSCSQGLVAITQAYKHAEMVQAGINFALKFSLQACGNGASRY